MTSRRPGWVAAIGLLLCIGVGFGAARIEIVPSYRAYFSADDPRLHAFDEVRANFDPSDALVILVEAIAPQSIYSPEGLDLVRALDQAAWRLPFVRRVDSLKSYPYVAGSDDGFELASLIPDGALDAQSAQTMRNAVLSDALLLNRLVDADGRVAVIAATVAPGHDSMADLERLIDAANVLIASQQREGFVLRLSGIVDMNYSFAALSAADLAELLPVAMLLLFAVLVLGTGSFIGSLWVMALALLSIIATLGIAGWLGVPFTSAAATAPLILMTVSIADGVHVLTLIPQRLAEGDAMPDAVRNSVRENRGPILLTTLTTIAGFLTMNFSEVPPFRVLGNMVAVGAGIACLMTLFWLPAMMMLVPPRFRTGLARAASGANIARWVARHAKVIVTVSVLVVLTIPIALRGLTFDDRFTHYFGEHTEFRQAADVQSKYLGGLYEIEYAIDANAPGAVHESKYLGKVQSFADFARAQPEVRYVSSWPDVLRRIEGAVQGDATVGSVDTLGQLSREETAQYWLLYQLSLPFGHDSRQFINADESQSRVLVTMGDMSSSQMLELEDRLSAYLAKDMPEYAEHHGSINLVFSHLGGDNVQSMVTANVFSVLVIGALVSLVLRSFSNGVLSVIMNVVPVAGAFAVWTLLGGTVGLSLSTSSGMTLGMLIDNAVHLLARARHHRQQGDDGRAAIEKALARISYPVLLSNVALICGFGFVAQSSLQLSSDIGGFTMLTLLLGCWVGLLLLPALFVLLHRPPRATQGG